MRSAALYDASHLTLDSRNNKSSIRTKMRVMNIDPDLIGICTSKKIMTILKEVDLNIFKKRKDATDVVLIDNNTDDISQVSNPKSKCMRLINGLTKYDNVPEDKIVVPIQILEGGYREWLLKYPHFTTNSRFNPDEEHNLPGAPLSSSTSPSAPIVSPQIHNSITHGQTPTIPKIIDHSSRPRQVTSLPKPVPTHTRPVPLSPKPVQPSTKPLPTSPKPVPLTPIQIKEAPGTAVPVGRSLARSHSSPNVAQAEGDENNNKHLAAVPRFDRTLKPTSVAINAIRAQLDFGRSPEASGKAITGLQNLGNTCFMNSVIQCLSYVPPLVSYFCSDLYHSHINFNSQEGSRGELAIELGGLIEKLNAHKHRYIEPKSFREKIVKHIGFAGNEQQDSHEFMMMLFEKLHHDLKYHKHDGKDKSIVSDLFEGMLTSTLTCTYCKCHSKTFEEFNCLSLPIPSETRCNIYECLRHFLQPERIPAWECPRCNQKREAEKEIDIHRLPKILIIHLKRFSQDGRWRQKLQTVVDFPVDSRLDVGHQLTTYNLLAVVNHYGHLEGGHYTAFCKLFNQHWYKFDDSNVSEIRDSNICGQAAYLLFYVA